MKFLLIAFVAVFIIFSCKKNNDNNPSGIYLEETPIAGRSQLNFVSNKLLLKSETISSHIDSFYYAIANGMITLTPAWRNASPAQSFEFKKLDGNSFQIENLYMTWPETAKTYMVYKK